MSLPLAALPLLLLCQAQAVSVSFDLRALPEADYRRWDGLGMERKVALRLVQEGLAVVASDSPVAQVRLRAVRSADGLDLVASAGGTELRERVRADAGSLAALHLEVAQKASALARRLAARVREVRPVTPPPDVESSSKEREAPQEEQPRGLELSASGGASWRGGVVDPLGLISVGHPIGPVELGAEVGLAPSRSAELSVFEVQGAAFLGHRVEFGTRWFIEPALGGGALVHTFHFADRWASTTEGTVVSPAAWARLRAGVAITPKLSVALRLALGAVRPLVHQSEGETLWERPGVRLETGASVGWSP